MIDIRPFDSLGGFQNDWLTARHHFSFSDYHDPQRMNWGHVRVWNDDRIAPYSGFARHGHRDMEIITYVRDGVVTHRDSLGNEGHTKAGDVQVMSAGSGILHEEMNELSKPTDLFQIWVLPPEAGGKPYWEAATFPQGDRAGTLEVLASGKPNSGALPIRADAELLAATLNRGQEVEYELAPGRHLYLVPATGKLTVNGHEVNARDGVAIADETEVRIAAEDESELILVETA